MNLEQLRKECKDPYYLITSIDGKQLFLREWPASQPSDIAILLLHGITAYSGPYGFMGKRISKDGYPCYGLDLRGHGLSDGIRGDYPSNAILLADLNTALDFLKTKYKRIILLGHSLGVVTASFVLKNFISKINGVVLLSAARKTREGIYPKRSTLTTMKILISSIFRPAHPIIHYYRDGIQGLDDPLFNFNYTLRFMKVFSPAQFSLPDTIPFPVYVGVGELDELFETSAVEALFKEIPATSKEFHVIPKAKHAVFPEDSWDHLITWIKTNF